MKSLQHSLTPEFQFAGIQFPKYVYTLPQGPLQARIAHAKNSCTGGYYHAPKPQSGAHSGVGFYLADSTMPGLRWQWADDVYRDIGHTGWFCDEYQDNKIRGIVLRVPHGRGFLAGWSMGEHMASTIEGEIHADETEAALIADEHARRAADNERECQAQRRAEEEQAERESAEQDED